MMMMKTTKIAVAVFLSASLAGAASADLIAGWDFSQYETDGSLDIGAGNVDTLPANYSEVGVGGTLWMDGNNGSSNVNELGAFPEVVARATDTELGQNGPFIVATPPATLPIVGFDSFGTLTDAGQTFAGRTGLTARHGGGLWDIVFEGDLGAAPTSNNLWVLNFVAFALEPTGNVPLTVEFAPACGGYQPVQVLQLTEDEQEFNLQLGGAGTQTGCVRMRLNDTNGQPVVDNVAVPEPGMAAGMVAGVLALVGLARRRT